MDINLADRLDRSIPTPTGDDGLADLLADGRHELRRRRQRRAGAVVASAAAVLVVAGGVALTPDRSTAPDTAPPVTSEPTVTLTPDVVPVPLFDGDTGPKPGETRPSSAETEAAAAPHAIFWFDEKDHAMTTKGAVGVAGTHLTVNNPWRLEAPANSGAVAASFQGHTWWVVAYLLQDGSTGTKVAWAGDAGELSLEEWARAQEEEVLGSPGAATEGGAGGQ